MNYKLKAAPTAKSKENHDQKGSKAKQILVGIDAGLNWYQAVRKVDNAVVGLVENFRSVGIEQEYPTCFNQIETRFKLP